MPRLREFRWAAWSARAWETWKNDQPSILAVDTETTGLGFYDEPFGATVTWRRPTGELSSWYFELGRPDTKGDLRAILGHTPTWVGHNAKFDAQKLILAGVIDRAELDKHELHDTATQFHLLNENERKGLKHLAVIVLNYDDTIEVEIKSGKNKGQKKLVPKEQYKLNAVRRKLKLTKDDGYHLLPREILVPYALRDTEFTLRLHETLWPRLQREGEDVLDWYALEMQLVLDLLDMEADGLGLDMPYLDKTSSEWGVKVMNLNTRLVKLVGRDDFNPNSQPQLMAAFTARGLKVEDTQAKTIEKIDDDLVRTLLEFRGAYKVYKTYLRAMQDDQRGGILHPNFNPTGARTGRLSSGSAKE
jgi:DNA polymerase I-like protein with 3'-5' exonuclease and polymerase domains